MWPWGHLAFGYVLYSFVSRAWFDGPPRGTEVYALLLATQLPDLVDKSLSWVFGVFPAGYSIAHSVFVAVPVALAVVALATRYRGVPIGVAFAVGYWSHLVGDLLVPLVTERDLALERVLWPVVRHAPYGTDMGALERAMTYFLDFLADVRGFDDPRLIALYFGPFLLALLIWVVDGMPGIPRPWRRAQRTH